ncbi:TPA: cellulose synthase [Enterobacter hormaechei subsp. xiangfangensis]|nr:cellulose synthase [Enterobacter hormaechei subsp. xiangfangensis]
MSRLTNWLLIPPVSSRLSERYRHYRHHGASSLSAALGCLWMILAWMFIPLEHPRWQRIRARHGELYPHINPDKPRPLDPALRYSVHLATDDLNGRGEKNVPLAQLRSCAEPA